MNCYRELEQVTTFGFFLEHLYKFKNSSLLLHLSPLFLKIQNSSTHKQNYEIFN